MVSLNPNERRTKGTGWTDTPRLIYPNPTQSGFLADIIDARKTGGDPRAIAGDEESISEMLNDESILKQEDRWRYVNPEDLVAIQTKAESSFAPVDLFCLPTIYNQPDRLATETSLGTLGATNINEASRRLILANRINELRKIMELHYQHVHKIHFVYEDHAGYSLSATDIHGGQVNIRQYVGAITDSSQLSGGIITRGEHYIDYTLPPSFNDDRGFSPEMFTGVAIRNPNIATSKQIPRYYRTFPDFGASWIQDLTGLNQDNIAANWAANFADAKPTRVKAEHINELRKALSAYALHTHELVLQTIDFQPVEDADAAVTGTAFGISLGFTDSHTPRYLQDLSDCSTADFITAALSAAIGLEVPLMYDYFYNGKEEATLADGILLYNDFQLRNFSDENYPDYLTAPQGDPEDGVMADYIKSELMLLFHSFAIDKQITLNHPSYAGTIIEKAVDAAGVPDTLLNAVPLVGVTPTTYITTPDILNKTGGPDYYQLGTAIDPKRDETTVVYDTKELLGNKGYVKVCFQPHGIRSLKFQTGSNGIGGIQYSGHGYGQPKRRAYLVSLGKDNCVATTPSPATVQDGPPPSYFRELDRYVTEFDTPNTGTKETRLFCRTITDENPSKVFNSTGALAMSNDLSETLYSGGRRFVEDYPPVHGDSYPYDYSDGASIFTGLYGLDRKFSEAEDALGDPIYQGVDEDDDSLGGDGRGLLYQGLPTDAYYFRDLNFTVDTTERWTQKEVQNSRGDLIEIWVEYSDFALHAGVDGDNLYSIHAALTDRYGQIIMHLAGDVNILSTEEDNLCEVEFKYDLNANKNSWLSFGIQKPSFVESIDLKVVSFKKNNDTIILESTETMTPDDMIEITSSASNDGLYRIRKIKDGTSIEVDAAAVSGIVDETPGGPLSEFGHKYVLTGETKIISETIQSSSDRNDKRKGWEDFHYSGAQTSWAVAHRRSGHGMSKRFRYSTTMSKDVGRGHGGEFGYVNSEFAAKMLTDSWFRTVPYKNPDSQLPSYYRSYEKESYIHDGQSVDLGLAPDTFSPVGAKAVCILGAPICYFNLDRGNSTKYSAADFFDTHPTVLRPTISDASGSVSGHTKRPPSLFDRAIGRWSVDFNGGDTPRVSPNKIRIERQVDVGDVVWVHFGHAYMSTPTAIMYTVLNVSPITMKDGPPGFELTLDTSPGTLTSWTESLNDKHKNGDNEIPPRIKTHYGYYPDFVTVPKDGFKHTSATYPISTSDMTYGLDFRFKSIMVAMEALGSGNHTVYGHQYLPVKNTKSVREIRSDAVSNTPTSNDSASFNPRTDSPVTQALANNESTVNATAAVVAGTILRAEYGTSKVPNGGREINSIFSNGNFQSNGYNIKELKGAIRNPATGKIVEPGDSIKAIDVNELYRGAEWLKAHNHQFEFEHITTANVFVNLP